MKPQSSYIEYRADQPLSICFGGDKVPLMQMEHLRQLDYPISRAISYENTVDAFLMQLAVSDGLRVLRAHNNMAILLNEQGVLECEEGKWYLIFTPDCSEQRTLPLDAPLYPVLERLYDKLELGEVSRVRVPDRSTKTLISGVAPFSILDEYCKSQPGGYLAVAQRIVLMGTNELFRHVPICRYGALASADRDEIESYHTIRALLDEYIYNYDHRAEEKYPKPISIAVFGPPGSGKSFGVRQIAKSRGRYAISSLNLSQYGSVSELFMAVHQAMQCGPDKIPLVFFDEFDSELNGVSRGWLKYFLAPMQDGEYTLDGCQYPVQGAVFVFAGGTASSFKNFLPGDDPEKVAAFRAVKGPDFVSRLKGILNIKGPNMTTVTDRKHIIRRAMLLRDAIMKSAPGICHDGMAQISRGLMSSLLRVSEYRHGSRSIEFILGMSQLAGVERYTPSCLPLDAQLDIHLDGQDFARKLSFEQVMGDMVEQYAWTAHEKYREQHIAEAKRQGATPEEIAEIYKEPEMADWAKLDEFFKEGHRSQIRYLGEQLQSFDFDVGLRPILEGASDTITELYGPVLEELSELEHERWLKDKLADGWRYGKKDSQLKISPDMVPYAQLEESTREFIRASVRNVPEYLKEIGYELYRKSYN